MSSCIIVGSKNDIVKMKDCFKKLREIIEMKKNLLNEILILNDDIKKSGIDEIIK